MSHGLTNELWDPLGLQGYFLCKIFHNHSELIAQLQMANNALEDQVMQAQGDVTNATAKTMSAMGTGYLGDQLGANCHKALRWLS